MKRVLFVTLFLLVLNVVHCNAFTYEPDSISKSEIQFNGGIYNLNSIDQMYSGKMYSGISRFVGIGYSHYNQKSRHHIDGLYSGISRIPYNLPLDGDQVYFGNGSVTSDVYHLNYTYFYKVKQNKVKKLNLFVTGSLFNFVNFTRTSYYELMSSTLAPGVYIESKGLKKHFYMQVSATLFSVISRNNYATSIGGKFNISDVSKNTRVLMLNKFRGVYANIGCSFYLFKKTFINVQYNLDYLKITYPRELTSVSGIYSIGISYKF